MFRGFREVEKNLDRLKREEERRKREREYLKIKPETNITVDECMNYVNNLFGNMSED